MKPLPILNPRKHVLVCVNEREDRPACKAVGGMEIFRALKEHVQSHGLAASIWITKTGCLGFCNKVGTTVVIYPEGKWFLEVTKEDLPHLLGFINEI